MKVKNITGSQRILDAGGVRHYINPGEVVEIKKEDFERIDVDDNIFEVLKEVKKNG